MRQQILRIYERIEGIVDEDIYMDFEDKGDVFGISLGVKEEQKIRRIISQKDFELVKHKLISK